MPSAPSSVLISANSIATSVIGRCLPVSTLASEIAVGSGSVIDEIFTRLIRSKPVLMVAPFVTCAALQRTDPPQRTTQSASNWSRLIGPITAKPTSASSPCAATNHNAVWKEPVTCTV